MQISLVLINIFTWKLYSDSFYQDLHQKVPPEFSINYSTTPSTQLNLIQLNSTDLRVIMIIAVSQPHTTPTHPQGTLRSLQDDLGI